MTDYFKLAQKITQDHIGLNYPYLAEKLSMPVCDGCQEVITGEVFETAYPPLSKFCSVDCRDAAEWAAEQQR